MFFFQYQDIEGVKNFERIVNNIGVQLRLPKEDVEGIKLAAMGGSRLLNFELEKSACEKHSHFQQARLFVI